VYTDEDLNNAVKGGIFTEDAVDQFRLNLSEFKSSSSVDEENFKLIGGFNDIFIVIACLLLLFSSVWVLDELSESVSMLVFSVLAWGLAEFFVLKRKMALPAIVLLLCFVGGVFGACVEVFGHLSESQGFTISALASTIAAYLHWKRFRVPITIAAGTAGAIGFIASGVVTIYPDAKDWLMLVVFICGLLAFLLAMYWDASDRRRVTHRSDVAFWLHLLSAPLMIHPVFSSLGIFDGSESISSMLVVVALYLLMTFLSIVVDRRAFMVSSLVYVLYALSNLLELYGMVGYSFAVTGVFIGSGLLLLSVFWHPVRIKLVWMLPLSIQNIVPEVGRA
jgi:hypothetical protein